MTCFPLQFSRLARTSIRRSAAPVRSGPPLETAIAPPRERRKDRQRRRQSSLSVMNVGDQACPETRPCPHPSPGDKKPARTLAGKADGTDVLLGNVEFQHRHAAQLNTYANPFAERLVGSIRRECLDHVIVFHEAGLRRILKDYFEYYERCRTHLSLEKGAPVSRPVELPSLGHPASPGIKPCFPCCSVRSPGGVSSITSRSRRSCWSWPFPPTPPSRIFRGYAVPLHKTTISRIPLPHEAAGLSTPTESIISASRAGRRSLDFVPRRNGSADPPVRRRRVPRFHSFAGGNGGPLAARRG